MLKRFLLGILIISLSFATIINAQSFEDNIKNLVEDNGKAYIQPLLTGFGTAVNSGLYKKASVSPGKLIPVGFDIGIVTSAALIPDNDKSFKYSTMDIPLEVQGQSLTLDYSDVYTAESNTTPTISGDAKGTVLERKSNSEIVAAINEELPEGMSISDQDININDIAPQSFSFPDGLNAAYIPIFALQANVRLPFIGLEVTGRGFPEYDVPDIGKISFYGGGLRKSLPVPIVDVTVGAFYQTMNITDIFEVENMSFHAEVGKDIGVPFLFKFSPYAGIGFDKTSGSINYELETASIPGMIENPTISYDFEGDNKLRMTAGLTAQIIPLTYLNIEVAQSEYLSGTISLGLIIK